MARDGADERFLTPGLALPHCLREPSLVGINDERTNDAQVDSDNRHRTAILTAALLPGQARAEERSCRGSLGAITVDNLRVPQGATCILEGTRVEGTITVQRNARLFARGVRVKGNVQAENARRVNVVRSSRINGAVEVEQGGAARIAYSKIGESLVYKQQDGLLRALRNDVEGSIQVFGNSGGARIYRNVVDGNLQCKENQPAPQGDGNVVGGVKEDQCAGF